MLKVDHVTIHFEGRDGRAVHALDRVSLDIPERGFIVALGTSGCGKSSLLNAIAGFLPVSDGKITLDGRPVDGPGADRGVVFQKDTLLPWASVSDNVALGLKFAGMGRSARRDRAADLLRLVGLEDFALSFPYELSGGMRQRVGIARALATDPDILLMDEPFGALDSLTRETMQELLVGIWSKTGKRIFFITHSIEEALLLGTEVVVMSPRPGRIVARYETRFVEDFVRDGQPHLIAARPDFTSLADEIRGIIHRPTARSLAA